jgi:hypothetical protein
MRNTVSRAVLCLTATAVLLGAAGQATAGYVDEVLADGPVAYYRLGEASGTLADNAVTTDGTNDGEYKFSPGLGQVGALYDDGDRAVALASDAVDGQSPPLCDRVTVYPFASFPSSAISVEFWSKTSVGASDQDTLFSYAATSSLNNEVLVYWPSNLRLFFNNNQYAATGVAVNDGRWHHLVATWRNSDGQVELYKDGVRVAQGIGHQVGGILDPNGSVVLGEEQDSVDGGFQASQSLAGTLDEVAIYDRALSAGEVARHYHAARSSVVSANIVVDDLGSWSVVEGGPGTMTMLGDPSGTPNDGDTRVGIAGDQIHDTDGILLATVRENGRGGGYGTVEAPRDTWTPGELCIATDRAGGAAEMNINVAAAFFPFAGYWRGAHVDASGNIVAANGISQGMLSQPYPTYGGRYDLKIPGVHSWDDGMLFTIGGSNSDRVVGAYPFDDGSGWAINIMSNASDYGASVKDDFSFLYMPYTASGLIGGLIERDGNVLRSIGDFTVTYEGDAIYRLSIAGKTPETGMLLLTNADPVTWAMPYGPQDNILWYYDDGSGDFIIRACDVPECTWFQETRFAFAYIDFENPPVIPEPTTLALLGLGGLCTLIRRRRTR